MAWDRRRYRGHKVWVHVDEAGRPVPNEGGLASVRYQPDDTRTYTVRLSDVQPLDEDPPPPPTPPDAAADAPPEQIGPVPERPVHVWIHGLARDEGGPAGIGVVLAWRDRLRELMRPLRAASAWEAELAALLVALRAIRRPELPVVVHAAHAAALRDILDGHGPHATSSLGHALRDASSRFTHLEIEEATARSDLSRAVALAESALEEANRRER